MLVHAFSSQRAWQTDGAIILPALFVTKTGKRLILYWTLGRPQENGPDQNNNNNNTQTNKTNQTKNTNSNNNNINNKKEPLQKASEILPPSLTSVTVDGGLKLFSVGLPHLFRYANNAHCPALSSPKIFTPIPFSPEGKCFNRTWFFASGVLHSESGGG